METKNNTEEDMVTAYGYAHPDSHYAEMMADCCNEKIGELIRLIETVESTHPKSSMSPIIHAPQFHTVVFRDGILFKKPVPTTTEIKELADKRRDYEVGLLLEEYANKFGYRNRNMGYIMGFMEELEKKKIEMMFAFFPYFGHPVNGLDFVGPKDEQTRDMFSYLDNNILQIASKKSD